MESRVLDEFPRLRIIISHGGGNVPYQSARYRALSIMNQWEPFEAFVKRLYFDTLTHSPEALRFMLDMMGSERVVLGTDHPFDVRDPLPRNHLERAGVTAEERTQVEQLSARQWLHGSVGGGR